MCKVGFGRQGVILDGKIHHKFPFWLLEPLPNVWYNAVKWPLVRFSEHCMCFKLCLGTLSESICMHGTLIKLDTKTVWRYPLGDPVPRMHTSLQPLSLPHVGFPLQHNFHFQFQATNEDMPLQYRSQFSVSVPKSIGNVSKLLYTKILTFGFPWNINIFAKTLSFYSPPLIFLKERLALLKRLHKMMTVCDPVFSLAITLGPKTLFQPLIESITVASHPLFHAFLRRCLFPFSSFFSSENNATFFQQQLQITLQGKKFTSLFQTHNWEKSSFYSMCISTDLRKYVTGVKRVKKRILRRKVLGKLFSGITLPEVMSYVLGRMDLGPMNNF